MSRFDNSKVSAVAPMAWLHAVPLRRAGPHTARALRARLPRALAWLAGLVFLTIAINLLAPTAWAQSAVERRVALVVGNADYPRAPLVNPVNDAADLSAALRRLGFDVIERRNRNSEELKRDLIEFQDKLGPGAVGLFYFAGHGMQAGRGGRNYLLPVGVDYRRERDVELFGLDASSVLARMEESGAALSLVILDACRDSPLPPEGRTTANRGLGRMEAPSGALVAFATAPGRTADENRAGRNGLYTQYLLRAIETPGLRLEDVFQQVRRDVERASNRRQSPEEISKLTSTFYFRPAVGALAAPATAPTLSRLPAAQGGGFSLADLEREQQARQAWAAWQQRMQADFDQIAGFQGAADLRAHAWQRFLGAWKDDNPTSDDDERLRDQAQQRLAAARRQRLPMARHPAPAVTQLPPPPQDYQLVGDEIHATKLGLIFKRCPLGQIWTRETCRGDAYQYTELEAFSSSFTTDVTPWRIPSSDEISPLLAYYADTGEAFVSGKYWTTSLSSFKNRIIVWLFTPRHPSNLSPGAIQDSESQGRKVSILLVRNAPASHSGVN